MGNGNKLTAAELVGTAILAAILTGVIVGLKQRDAVSGSSLHRRQNVGAYIHTLLDWVFSPAWMYRQHACSWLIQLLVTQSAWLQGRQVMKQLSSLLCMRCVHACS
jgi:hypothetical protein